MKIHYQGPECLLPGTQILTEEGWKVLDDITKDDKIATKVASKVMTELIYEHPTKVIHEEYEGDIYTIKNKFIDLGVTPNHRMVVRFENQLVWEVLPAGAVYGANVYLPTENHDLNYIDATEWWHHPYKGLVHCVNIPHHFICVRTGNHPGVWTGNSERAGIDVRVAYGAKLGSDGRLYQKFYDRHTKRNRWMSASDLDGLTVKLPD